jgi:alginate O-acetyltransferase complex protein AlgI
VNLMLTMALGGLWHGAAWTFVVWGLVHGAWLALHRAIRERGLGPRTPEWMRRVVTFHLVCLTWVLFRARRLEDAVGMLHGLGRTHAWLPPASREAVANAGVSTYTGAWVYSPEAVWALVLLFAAAGLHAVPPASRWRARLASWPPSVQGIVYATILLFVFLHAPAGARFIYFQF